MISRYARGQIWLIKTYIAKFDRVFSGEHFALILGVNDEKTLTVVPATSKFNAKNKLLTSVELELVNLDGVKTVGHFIPNMIQTIDVKKTCSYVGMLDELSVIEVQKAVGKYLGFDTIRFEENENSKEERAFAKVETEEKQESIKIASNSNIGRPSKLQPKVGDIKCFKGKEYKKIVDGKEKYNSIISKWPKEVLDNIVEEYINGSPKVAIAFEYGISDSKVGQYLRSRGLK